MTATLEIERRRLGRSPLTIPRVALGCGNFGGVGSAPAFFGQGLNDDEAFALMDAAWELGITHFDTADAYGGGRSESAIGRWIASRGVLPQITTKVFNPMREGSDKGLGAQRIERQLRASLERLGLERVDLYMAHEFDPDVPLEETLGVFSQLRAKRRIAAYGVSNFDADQLKAALRAGAPAAIQSSHSLLDRHDEADVLPLCVQQDIAYLAIADKFELDAEMRYTNATRRAEKQGSANEFVIGPSANWKPNLHTMISVAPLFGCTADSPRVAVLCSVSLEFGGGESKTVRTCAGRGTTRCRTRRVSSTRGRRGGRRCSGRASWGRAIPGSSWPAAGRTRRHSP